MTQVSNLNITQSCHFVPQFYYPNSQSNTAALILFRVLLAPRYNNRSRFDFDFEDAEVFLLCYFKTLWMAALKPEHERNLFEWMFAIYNIKFCFLAQLNFINTRDVCMYFPSLILQLCWLLFFRFIEKKKGE